MQTDFNRRFIESMQALVMSTMLLYPIQVAFAILFFLFSTSWFEYQLGLAESPWIDPVALLASRILWMAAVGTQVVVLVLLHPWFRFPEVPLRVLLFAGLGLGVLAFVEAVFRVGAVAVPMLVAVCLHVTGVVVFVRGAWRVDLHKLQQGAQVDGRRGSDGV